MSDSADRDAALAALQAGQIDAIVVDLEDGASAPAIDDTYPGPSLSDAANRFPCNPLL